MAMEYITWEPVGEKKVLRVRQMIGEGVRSQIYEGVFQEQPVAVKSMLFDGSFAEVEILRKLNHPNIIRIHFTDKNEKTLYMALELCSCTLTQYVKKSSSVRMPPVEVLKQITDGLDYLHNGQAYCTVHRDLKPSNILFQFIDREKIWRVKISDFGISKEFASGRTSTRSDLKGSIGYIAPELLDRPDGSKGTGRIGKETDIFSLGVIFYYVLSEGKHPFSNDFAKMNEMIRDSEPKLDSIREEYKDDAELLILSMIKKDYKQRITIGEVKSHPIFWSAKEKVDFLREVSNFFEDREVNKSLLIELEKLKPTVCGKNWSTQIANNYPEIKKVMEKGGKRRRMLGQTSLQQLLRAIRNWSSHYRDPETPKGFKDEIGSLYDGFIAFFAKEFPKLLPCVYDFMRQLKEEEQFQQFYGIETAAKSEDNPEEEPMEITDVMSEDVPMENASAPISSGADGQSVHTSKVQRNDEAMSDGEGILDSSDEEEKAESGSSRVNTEKLYLRKYQEELAEQALNDYNSLIIAPTGSGKTAVANEIIKNHLASSKSKSVIFLVSKTTLARQQYEFFSRHLDLQPTEIAYLIGEITSDIAAGAIIKKMRLTILTPQILIDEMNRHSSFITFDDISMMIFDECHNATKKHPYKVIMEMMLDYAYDHPNHVPIQIVGMTASPGVGKGKTREKVMENLITLLANLNVFHNPAIVAKNKAELKRHQNQIDESYVRVELGVDKFTQKILKAMTKIEGKIEEKGILGKQAGQFHTSPENKDKQKYENWVMDLIRHVKKNVYDRDVARVVNMYASHLKMYHNLLYLKKLIPRAMDVTNALGEFEQAGPEGQFLRQINTALVGFSKEATIPMLIKLFEILKEEFEGNKESRCIIFVPRRAIAPALADAIQYNNDLKHLQPKSLTGSNEHADLGGMTKSEQQNSMKAFRDGKSKILIATSVAEEGLDIRACNLVIMYNYVTGEVGRIQRAGRGRAENSRSILITSYGSEQIEREKMNSICALATETAIEDLQRLDDEERLKKIKIIQEKERIERLKSFTNERRLLQEACKWKILCGQCFSYITQADKIQHIKNQHRFVVDEGFCSRVLREPCEPRPIAPGLPDEKVATFKCANTSCLHYLGVEMQHKHKTYPTLTVKQLVFEDNLGKRATPKQWSKCPFAVKKAVDDEEEIDETRIKEFVLSQAKAIKGFASEECSDDDAKEIVDLANDGYSQDVLWKTG